MGLAIDGVNNLYVADQANNRVLEFNEFGSPGNKVANGAGGQIDRSHNGPNFVDAIGENSPGGIAVDATSQPPHRHLYVADTVNNRVLGWSDVTAFAAAQPADIVLGQPDLFSFKCNNGVAAADVGGLGADSLCGPARMAVDQTGKSVRRGFGQQSRAGVQHAVQRGQRRAGRGRRDGGFRLRAGRACSRRGAAIRAARMRRRCAIRRRWRSTRRGTSILRMRGTTACSSSRRRAIRRARPMRLRVDAYGQGGVSDFSDTLCADGVGRRSVAEQSRDVQSGRRRDRRVGESVCRGFGQQPRDRNRRAARRARRMRRGCSGRRATLRRRDAIGGAMAPGASTLCAPAGLMLDVLGNLWVADANNDRVLEYAAPFSSDTRGGDGDRAGRRRQFHDLGMRRRNRAGRLVRAGRGQLVRAGGGGGRCEYRPVRGGHAEQSIDGL